MGVLNDFLGILRDFNHIGDDIMEDTINRKRYSSISKRALEGIMQFPTIVSRSIDIDTLQMITKALEKQYASFAQTAISMSPFLNLKKDKDAAAYLRKFHQNSSKGNLRDEAFNILAYVDTKESFNVLANEDETVYLMSTVAEGSYGPILQANKRALVDLMEGVRESIVNDLFVPSKHRRIKDDFIRAKHTPIYENNGGNKSIFKGNVYADQRGAKYTGSFSEKHGDTHVGTQNVTYNVKGGAKGSGLGQIDQKLPPKVLLDNDVKKANELVPTSMHIRTTLINSASEVQGNLDFIAGVKATMHPVSSEEMVVNIVDGIKSAGKFFKFIRWTTGEIAFAKDYLFNLTEIKDDVVKTQDRNNKWFTALKRRRRLAKFKKNLFLPGDLLPNASIVISIEEVDFIKSEYGFDLLDPVTADKLMREYFLIGFTVVDNAGQLAHFLFDGLEDYQTVTFSGLERGDLNGGNNINFKDVLKLVQRA